MKINEFVFDTNALVSAILIPASVSRKALRKADNIGSLAFSTDTLEELRKVITRVKFDRYLSISERLEFVQRWEAKGKTYETVSHLTDCRDPKDNKFLDLAFDSDCAALVTGDADLLILHPFNNIPIITPAEFLDRYP